MEIRLKTALATDERWLDQLRRGVYQELFRATWGGWDEARHMRQFAKCWKLGNISLIEVDGVRVGMIQLFDSPDSVEVGEIQIELSHQNRGIGAALLRDVTTRAHRQRKTVLLSVGLQNHGALRLYQRLGFRLVEKTETHHHLTYAPCD